MIESKLKLPCGAELSNRLAKSAMSEALGDRQGLPTDRLAKVYDRWSRSGAGLLITGNVMIDRAALGEPGNIVIEPETEGAAAAMSALTRWAEAGQRRGIPVWVQLNHPGRQTPRVLSPVPVAPSAVPLHLKGGIFAPPRALADDEIPRLVDRFAAAARIAKKAGFQGVQIHGAHGYLITQFLSPITNLRTDRWGGSIENRMAFPLSILRAIRAEVGPAYPIGFKLNSADFQRGGFSENDAITVAKALEAGSLDLLEISGGSYERPEMMGSARTVAREAYFLEFARRLRQELKIPIMLTGGFRSRAVMEGALASGAIDVVGLARPFAIMPDVASCLIAGQIDRVETPTKKTGFRWIDPFVGLQWYTHQIHRLGAGKEASASLSPWWVAARMAWMGGWSAFRSKRI